MEFFEGFAWPVPLAFAAALGAARFEQGDVLFREAAGYDPLEGRLSGKLSAIQVLLPPRGTRSTPAEREGDRRQSNWESELTIELVDLVSGESETRAITQGKLLMALWKGRDEWLDADCAQPPVPRSARELQQRLDQSLASFDSRASAKAGCRFVFVVDRASESSLAKARSVEEGLHETGDVRRRESTPCQAGIDDGEQFHPTLMIRCLDLPGRTVDEVVPVLRARLYGGANEESVPSGEDAGGRDRFSVTRHGLLIETGPPAKATRSRSKPS